MLQNAFWLLEKVSFRDAVKNQEASIYFLSFTPSQVRIKIKVCKHCHGISSFSENIHPYLTRKNHQIRPQISNNFVAYSKYVKCVSYTIEANKTSNRTIKQRKRERGETPSVKLGECMYVYVCMHACVCVCV